MTLFHHSTKAGYSAYSKLVYHKSIIPKTRSNYFYEPNYNSKILVTSKRIYYLFTNIALMALFSKNCNSFVIEVVE